MRYSRRTILATLGLAIFLAGSASTYYLLHRQTEVSGASTPATEKADMPSIRFYGLAIDETGSPVAGARVDIFIRRLPPGSPPPDWSPAPGKVPPEHLRKLAESINLHTDKDGKFSLEDKGYTLQIGGIGMKPGYVDVSDLAWDWPKPFVSRLRLTNRYFIYEGGFPIYLPDKDRPAIFPLHRKGSSVAGMPSRGGSDQLADGRIVRNERIKPLIPSTGPGAPITELERTQRLRRLEMSPSTTQTAPMPQ